MLRQYQIIQMAKPTSPKLKLSFLNSFQICRPKKPSTMAKSPSPAVTLVFSPVNCKSFDISFPSFPDAPPSTPSKITPFGSTSQTYAEQGNKGKLLESPVSSDSDATTLLITPSRNGKRNDTNAEKKSKAMSISSYESDDSDGSLFSSCHSFNSSYDHFNNPCKASKKPMQQKSVRAQGFKHFNSKEWKRGNEYHEKKSSISGKLVPCMRIAKVHESFVVVKRSIDPYKDFKNSMLEMVLEKQIFEPKELEHLLMSFLSLNSRMHHNVIIDAFTEIIKCVHCG